MLSSSNWESEIIFFYTNVSYGGMIRDFFIFNKIFRIQVFKNKKITLKHP